MKTKIKIKNRTSKEVLFELEKENNSILNTLMEAIKQNVNLCGADLYGADLYGANLCEANLCEADLYGADLCEADLYGANLCRIDLYGANLCRIDLRRAKNVPSIPFNCPSDGAFIGWKK